MPDEERKHNLTYSFCKTRPCKDCPFSTYFAERHNIPRVECSHMELESTSNISKVINLWCGEYDINDRNLQQTLESYDVLNLFNDITGKGVDWV